MITVAPPAKTPDQVLAIAWMMSCARLSQIKQGTLSETPTDRQTLIFSMIPSPKEDIALWIGRLLAHFPRRDSTKDAIVLSDICRDLVGVGASAVAVCQVCEELRHESNSQNPFMPQAGEIRDRVKLRMWFFNVVANEIGVSA